MKVVMNKVRLAQKAQNANVASISGMVALLAGVVLPLVIPSLGQVIPLIIILVGVAISMAGIYQANRWVRKPRPEEQLSKALKGLDDKYVLYHYPSSLPCDHVLLTPEGVVVLETVNLAGQFVYKDGRWVERMTMGRALRSIVEERLGDPDRSALAVRSYLAGKLSGLTGETITVKPLIVFTHPAADLDLEPDRPVPVYMADKLKKHVPIEGPRLSPEAYQAIAGFLEKAVKS
jgi:Nuclease-related domain